MERKFEKYSIKVTEKELDLFEKYASLMLLWNEKFNITTITENEEIYLKHFVDSLLCESIFSVDKCIIDIGSGGGLPAIPLKILRPDLNITMVEATGKKCIFLNEWIYKLGLKDIKVINGRAEELAKTNLRESFDYGTARAVARFNTLSEYVMPFVKVGGQFISYKGRVEEELNDGKRAISILGGNIKEIKSYQLGDALREVVIVDKIKSTPSIYPRGRGKERSKPL